MNFFHLVSLFDAAFHNSFHANSGSSINLSQKSIFKNDNILMTYEVPQIAQNNTLGDSSFHLQVVGITTQSS